MCRTGGKEGKAKGSAEAKKTLDVWRKQWDRFGRNVCGVERQVTTPT